MSQLRVVFVCDEYPPFDRGGYAQLCFDLAHALRQRGHHVTVLCKETNGHIQETEQVVRGMRIPVCYEDRWPIPIQQIAFASMRRRYNCQLFRQVLSETQAQAVLIWPTHYVDSWLMYQAERIQNLVVAYYTAGFSPTEPSLLASYWQSPGRSSLATMLKSLLRPVLASGGSKPAPLAMKRVMCVSEYERQRVIRQGVPPENVMVVHNGIDVTHFRFLGLPSTRRKMRETLKVLYSGRLDATKGAHLIIEAVAHLRRTHPSIAVCIGIVGTGKSQYVRELDHRIVSYALADRVKRYEWIQRDRVPRFMSDFDVLVLPTIHPEPLARVVQEAMAMGLVVIATDTGGTREIVHDGVTGLAFAPDSPVQLAECLRRLYADLALCDRLSAAAHDLVNQEFTIDSTAESVERRICRWMEETNGSNQCRPSSI